VFSCERPVLFIDVPKKCLNPEADRIDMVPIERSIREMVGRVVRVDKLNELPSLIEELYANAENVAQSIREVRNNSVFNLNGSVEGAVNRILEISSSKKGV
jgi:YidC/Oxa1 family membrane protein insertase